MCPSSQKAIKYVLFEDDIATSATYDTSINASFWTWTWIKFNGTESIDARARARAGKRKGQFACDFVVSNSCAVPADKSFSHLRSAITHALLYYLPARMRERDWSSAAPFFIRVGFLDGSGLKRIRARRIIGNESHQGRAWPAHTISHFFSWSGNFFNACASPTPIRTICRGWRPEPPQAVHIAEGQLCNLAKR